MTLSQSHYWYIGEWRHITQGTKATVANKHTIFTKASTAERQAATAMAIVPSVKLLLWLPPRSYWKKLRRLTDFNSTIFQFPQALLPVGFSMLQHISQVMWFLCLFLVEPYLFISDRCRHGKNPAEETAANERQKLTKTKWSWPREKGASGELNPDSVTQFMQF